MRFSIGDIVTRIGTDEQEVLDMNEDRDLMLVRCIKAPHDGFCCVGDEEWNLPGRYELVRKSNFDGGERWEKKWDASTENGVGMTVGLITDAQGMDR